MSRSKTSKRAILEATLAALEAREAEAFNMGKVAKRVGISRQALYLYFASRSELAIETARYADEKYGIESELAPVMTASTGSELLEGFARFVARYNPKIYPIVRAADALRFDNPAIAAAWAERLAKRRRGNRRLAIQLQARGELASMWSVNSAGDWLTSHASVKWWEELVIDLGWSHRRFEKTLAQTLKASLLD